MALTDPSTAFTASPIASASLSLMACSNMLRVFSSATLPFESASSFSASSTVLSSLEDSTALTAFPSDAAWVLYQAACLSSFDVASSRPALESATHPSYSGTVVFNALASASTVLASFTWSAVTAEASAAFPLTTAL